MIRNLIPCMILWLTGASQAHCRANPSHWSLGAIFSSEPGFSVLLHQSHKTAIHVGAFFFSGSTAELHVDVQSYTPLTKMNQLYENQFQFEAYTGFGLGGEISSDEVADEKINLRFPIGLEMLFRELPLIVFTDVAIEIGPMPKTAFNTSGRLGLRTKI